MSDAYQQFLEAKMCVAERQGFDVDPVAVNARMKPHCRAIVPWLLAGGRRALFASFGLHKTVIQLEAVRLASEHADGRGLIVLPLGVRQEFKRDAVERLGWAEPPTFIRRIEEAGDTGVYLTNYETVRDGKLDPRQFVASSLDEADCLRGFGGSKTFREFMKLFAGDDRDAGIRTEDIRYRFVATATPSPNDYIELLAYAAYLGIMDVAAAKTRFFKRNSEKADALTLHPHKEEEFWLWVASWALFVQRPSDLGFSDEGYQLPELDVHWHEIPTNHADAGTEKDGQGRLFRNAAIGVQDAAREKRESLDARMAKMMEIRAETGDAHRLLWHDLEDERRAIERLLPRAQWNHWQEYQDGHPAGLELFERHYSALPYRDGRERDRFAGPGYKTVLLTRKLDALFVWRKFIDDSGQQGINCAVFRNEGDVLSSELIMEAMAIAWQRWPGERLYTYVNASKVQSSNPGYCFLKAGWQRIGRSKTRGLMILEALPGTAVPAVERHPVCVSVYGTQDLDEREQAIIDFSDGKFRELAAKPVIAGAGCNFQRHCWHAIFTGIGFKFRDFIQAVHRLQRFGQTRTVRVDIIYTEAEREVRRDLERKWRQHIHQGEKMSQIIQTFGLAHAAMASKLARSLGVERVEASGQHYTVVNNDCVLETRSMAADSVHLIVTSIPFSTQYEYSPSYNDFGHTDDNPHFWQQMDFLIPELLRVLQPGRVAAIHVKDRITPGGINGFGFQTVQPFSDECIQAFTKHGFAFLARKTIVTDVVRENNQTYRLGWTEQCKDGSRMGAGMPEYLLIFRKPPSDRSNGYADVPVVKDKAIYTRPRWQFDAHGFARSSGDRPLMPEELEGLDQSAIFKMFKQHSLQNVYDFRHDVRIAEAVDKSGWLPTTFMLLQPQSWHPDVWTDITRMRTLNGAQAAKGKEMHLCPLQFDIVDRAIEQYTMEGETVYDPFGGLMTVPYCAIKLKR
jgi:DNA modification methylase